ncbi:12085_t:CDS:2 [Rhizophagus irregularis]|nr:12085_t:CDS:2 [Rhizophagus irregularis]
MDNVITFLQKDDLNLDLDNDDLAIIRLSPESIAKFLEEQEEVKDDFTKPHELCINRFDFQRKGRDETLHKIYDCIVKRYISIKNTLEKEKSVGDKSLHPILALQATPGGGKSFLLDELAALKSEDFDNYLKSKEQPNRECSFIIENAVYREYIEIVNDVIDILRNSIVVCITYNGSSTYKNDSFVDANVQRGLVMRILWSYFFDDAKLSWQVFLCVDETMKISPNTDDVNRRQHNINELLNNLYSRLMNDKGKLIKFNFILTTLDAVYVRTNSTYSGKKIDWVPLRRLEISESTDLFHKILNVIKRALLGNSTRLSHKINTLNREYSISDLISIGVYINSLTKVEETVSVVPTLNLVSIQYFCNMYEEEGLRDVHRLSDAYNTTTKGDVKIMLRRKKIIKLDRSVEFPPRDGKICGEQGVFIKNFEEYIFVPDKTNNSGFDMTIFEKVGGGEFEMTMEDIYLVIIAWGDIDALDSDIKDNKNIIIVGKDSLEKAYTPTLVTRPQFYDNMLQGRDKISQEVMERVNERYRSS